MGYVNFLAAAYREKDAAGADEYQDSDSSQKTEGILASLLCGKCRVARKRRRAMKTILQPIVISYGNVFLDKKK